MAIIVALFHFFPLTSGALKCRKDRDFCGATLGIFEQTSPLCIDDSLLLLAFNQPVMMLLSQANDGFVVVSTKMHGQLSN